jgi:hypothetical protein
VIAHRIQDSRAERTTTAGSKALDQSELGVCLHAGSSDNADFRRGPAHDNVKSDLAPQKSSTTTRPLFLSAPLDIPSPNNKKPLTLNQNHQLITKETNNSLQMFTEAGKLPDSVQKTAGTPESGYDKAADL